MAGGRKMPRYGPNAIATGCASWAPMARRTRKPLSRRYSIPNGRAPDPTSKARPPRYRLCRRRVWHAFWMVCRPFFRADIAPTGWPDLVPAQIARCDLEFVGFHFVSIATFLNRDGIRRAHDSPMLLCGELRITGTPDIRTSAICIYARPPSAAFRCAISARGQLRGQFRGF